jgi:hypothetical protein
LHTNTVRIILQAWTIGYPTPQPIMLTHLAQMLALAQAHGLRVQLTLFDWWNSYDDLTGSRQWARDPGAICARPRHRLHRAAE